MPLFQASVLKKYISQLDKPTVQKAYKKYCKFFHDAKTQENIRNSKEEQFQEGFLRELFVDILGYTLNPTPKFNLTTELKNLKGAKKVDGAILKDDKALAVIELKGTNTKDLESIRQQAFDYKANQIGCVYVITSNFEKLRFYINNAVDFEEFNLFTLTETEFELFYLCLAKDNLLANKPLTIKEASIVEEENITKKFYGDYSIFKRELYRDLVKQNMKNETFRELTEKNIKLTLFKKSQKLIDRFLFILFAEDRGLLSPNSISTILSEWKALEELDMVVPLYDRYKQYFSYLDTGRKGTDKKEEIFAYNGGLFQPDVLLDAMIIDDDLLYRHTKKLTTYDFQSQVDVNILGHIFENSLNELDEVKSQLEGAEIDKTKTKRKKDGVFYTPKYITKYIVENTVGKLCTEKKAELGIADEDYTGDKKRQKKTLQTLVEKLDQYRKWLLQLTICDPACGSGSLLLKFAKVLGKENVRQGFYGQEVNITTYNLCRINMFLHDINFEKFNITHGDTLTDPMHWDDEPFDAIVSNPPYSIKWEGDANPLLINDPRFAPAGVLAPKSKADLAFTMHMLSWLATSGTAAIVEFPGVLYRGGAEQKIRKYLIDNNYVDAVIQLPPDLFFGTTIATCIIVLKKSKADNATLFIDASAEFVRGGNKNKITDDQRKKILNAFIERKDIDHFAMLVPNQLIAENDYNIAVSSYIEQENTEEETNIKELNTRIAQIVKRQSELRTAIDAIVNDLESIS